MRDGVVLVLARGLLIEARAAEASALHEALAVAKKEYEATQAVLRAFGERARDLWHQRFGTRIASIRVLFTAEDGAARSCTVTAAQRYTVDGPMVLAARERLTASHPSAAEAFGACFTIRSERRLRANALELLEGVLRAAGAADAAIPALLDMLVVSEPHVDVVGDFEERAALLGAAVTKGLVPDELPAVLAAAVRRAAPSVSFAGA